MTTREKIEVLEAYERGEVIQYTAINGGFIWVDLYTDDFDFIVSNYRIKPKEKKMVTVYEYIHKSKVNGKWYMRTCLYKNDYDFINDSNVDEFQKTGREFQVEEY